MKRPPRFWIWILISSLLIGEPAYAVVGKAEDWDRFKRDDLQDFQENIMSEESQQRQEAMNLEAMQNLTNTQTATSEPAQPTPEEVQQLKKELLRLPKRDRVRFEVGGQYQFDSNIERRPIHEEESDSVFDAEAASLIDLSGKKTDLRLELRGGHQWNQHFPRKDFWQGEERIRYRRKYWKKLLHSLQSRVARNDAKTIEVNDKRVRWDSEQNTAFNYAFSPKLSLNQELQMTHRYYTTEPFDQDSTTEWLAAPSAFMNITPKSRVSLGYRFGANRIHSKSGDANAHEVSAGYFGRVSRKSSASLDVTFSHQVPKSRDTSTLNAVNVGMGYIWQMTPKTQLFIQLIRSQQNSSSDLISGTNDQVTKTDTHYTNNSISLSLNSRLTAKLSAVLTGSVSHLRTKVAKAANEDPETQQTSFPVSINFNYFIRRWILLTTGYTFSYRIGDERADYYRSHLIQVGLRVLF